MLNQKEALKIQAKHRGAIINIRGTYNRLSFKKEYFMDDSINKIDDNIKQGEGRGLRGLGMCGHPTTKWPITHIHEETDDYIIACCDAGCAVLLLKDSVKKKKPNKKKSKLIITKDGRVEKERMKNYEDNQLE